MDPLEGKSQVFETADIPLTEQMQIRHDVQRQVILYLSEFLRAKYPYREENDYAAYVVSVIGPGYNRWYKKLCGSITDAVFVKNYYDEPRSVIEGMVGCSNVDKYMRGFYERFKKKIRKKVKQERKSDISGLISGFSKSTGTVLDQKY